MSATILYIPLTGHARRKDSRLHFSTNGLMTECGLSTENMDSGCLDTDMDFGQAREQQDTCQRCMRSMSANDPGAQAVQLKPERLELPLSWRKPRRVFVNSVSDLFHEDVPDEFLLSVFDVMRRCTWAGGQNCGRIGGRGHTFQVLTKRPERMCEFMRRLRWTGERLVLTVSDAPPSAVRAMMESIWLGVSVENQAAADERIPILLDTPAAVRFLSCEPLLGPLDLDNPLNRMEFSHDTGREAIYKPSLNWVIVGGESGTNARPCDVAWIRSIVAQCAEAKVPCFVKQMGKWITGDHTSHGCTGFDTGFIVNRWLMDDGSVFIPSVIGANAHARPANAIAFGNCDTHGGNWVEWPDDLRVRQFPVSVEVAA